MNEVVGLGREVGLEREVLRDVPVIGFDEPGSPVVPEVLSSSAGSPGRSPGSSVMPAGGAASSAGVTVRHVGDGSRPGSQTTTRLAPARATVSSSSVSGCELASDSATAPAISVPR